VPQEQAALEAASSALSGYPNWFAARLQFQLIAGVRCRLRDSFQNEGEEERMGTSSGIPMQPAAPRKGWFGRNWKWFVPTGCMTIIVLIVALIGGIFVLAMGTMKSSDAYTQAMARVQADPQVADKLGRPVTPGWFISGNVNVNGDSGDANLSIPISGPKGKGKIYVEAKKSAGTWQFETLQVEVVGQPGRIDLLQETQAAPPAMTQPAAPAAEPTPEAAASAAAPAPEAAAAAAVPGGVIASAQYNNDPELRCDLLEVKRVSGDALLIRWRLINTSTTKRIHYDFDWPEVYYTDPAENKKYSFLTDSAGARVLDIWYGDLNPGEQRLNWAKFPAPPATSKKITAYIPKFMPFEDAPVAQ
jgi:hypothetical protein